MVRGFDQGSLGRILLSWPMAILLWHDAVQGRQTGQQLHWAAIHESQEASDENSGSV